MNDRTDPRLLEWLEIARRITHASDSDALAGIAAARDRRAELQASLEERPPEPDALPDAELARALAEAEQELEARTHALLADVRAKVTEVRDVRAGTKGYKQARGNPPALISRSA